MPIYQYICSKCEKEIELFQKISDPPAEKCKECGGRLKKLISNTSFILKGSGWFKTGYGNKKKSKLNKKRGKEGQTFGRAKN